MGRGETNFTDLVNRICNAKNLDFDLVVLKPEVGPAGQRFESTMSFKQEFLRELVFTYKNAEEIRIYEDRPKHVKGFRDYFERLNKSLLSHPADQPPPVRKPITADVVHVCELRSSLNPETEVNVVQKAINGHNHAVANGGPNPTKSIRRHLKIVEQFDRPILSQKGPHQESWWTRKESDLASDWLHQIRRSHLGSEGCACVRNTNIHAGSYTACCSCYPERLQTD